MNVTIIGSNGMLSVCLTKELFAQGHSVHVYGLDAPVDYPCSSFTDLNLLKNDMDYDSILDSDLIVYAAGAGVQPALKTDSSLMYALNVNAPIEITLQLKKRGFKGTYISFGSYMEIGLNDVEGKNFSESEVICSPLPVTNDYALSKRLYSRYMNELTADYTHWHFILPNMFSYDDIKPGTRLIPYVLNYLINYNKGLNPPKPSFSSGVQTRQFILMEDIIQVIDKAIEKKMPSGTYNIGGGEFISIRNFIEGLFKLYNVPCDDSMFGKEIRRDGDIKSLQIDGKTLFEQIKYLPTKKITDTFNQEMRD